MWLSLVTQDSSLCEQKQVFINYLIKLIPLAPQPQASKNTLTRKNSPQTQSSLGLRLNRPFLGECAVWTTKPDELILPYTKSSILFIVILNYLLKNSNICVIFKSGCMDYFVFLVCAFSCLLLCFVILYLLGYACLSRFWGISLSQIFSSLMGSKMWLIFSYCICFLL